MHLKPNNPLYTTALLLAAALGCSEANVTLLDASQSQGERVDVENMWDIRPGSDTAISLPDTSHQANDSNAVIQDIQPEVVRPDEGEKPNVQLPDTLPSPPEVTTWPDIGNDTSLETDTTASPVSCTDEPVAVFQIYPLDIWAQAISTATVILKETSSGNSVQNTVGKAVAFAMCQKSEFTLVVSAPHYESLNIEVSFNGTESNTSVTISKPNTDVGYVFTTTLAPAGSLENVRHFTLWTGLPHHYFAPTGFPARHGTSVTLYTNGYEAWNNLAIDLDMAKSQVTMATWWWESDFEIFRDASHIWLSPTERWKNTIMGQLNTLWGVKRKVLVNQFFTQDGLLGQYNVDDSLVSKAQTPDDNFEYMGIANPIPAKFWAAPSVVNFYSRLDKAFSGLELETTALKWAGLKPFMTPIYVDTTDLPLGLGYLDVSIASWHQKFATIDGQVAYVGGMNTTAEDWDTKTHKQYQAMRMDFEASTADREAVALKKKLPAYPATRDHMIRLEGPTATDVEAVFGSLWKYQLNNDALYANLSTPAIEHTLAPPMPGAANVVQSQLLFTVPKPFGEYSILESLMRAISRAKHYIYIEDQYFRSPVVAKSLISRMQSQPSLRLVVITNAIDEWKDMGCWHTYKQLNQFKTQFPSRFAVYQLMSFDAIDTGCVLCIDEVEATFQPFYLHSKMVIIDDLYMEVGSANQNNRSMLYDAEMAVAVFDETWVKKAREQVTKVLLGPYFQTGMTPGELWYQLKAVAQTNQLTYDYWSDEGFDLNLNGKPVPGNLTPQTPLYPLSFGPEDDCFLEGIGADVI